MRDTKALQHARLTEPNPYLRRFGLPKWNRSATVTDDHRLFHRLPEFDGWTSAQHETAARDYITAAIEHQKHYRAYASEAFKTYGDGNGVLISGVLRDHFPEEVKTILRTHAHGKTDCHDRAFAHWRAAGKTLSTFRMMVEEAQGRTVDDRPIGQRTRQ